MPAHTMFGDLRQLASTVFRVTTQGGVYLVGLYELRGRRFAVVRGAPGTAREHVVVRDSDPRIGERSLFDVPIAEWPGQSLEVATMTSSPIAEVEREGDLRAIAAVMGEAGGATPWVRAAGTGAAPPGALPQRAEGAERSAAATLPGDSATLPPPPGMSESPRIAPLPARGTRPAADMPSEAVLPADAAQHLAARVVVGQPVVAAAAPEEIPYPRRHVGYAESVTQLLRSIARRDRIFEDLASQRELRERLRRALDECAALLEVIRRRDRA